MVPRATQFWDDLIKALRLRGHSMVLRNFEPYTTILEHDFQLRLREKVKMETIKDGNWDRRIFHPTGILCFQVKGYPEKEWQTTYRSATSCNTPLAGNTGRRKKSW